MSSPKWALAPFLVVVSTAVAVLGRLAFDWAVGPAPAFMIPFFIPVIAVALYHGTRWGLFATALNTAIVAYFFTAPLFSFGISDFGDQVRVVTFVVVGGMLSGLTGSLRSHRLRAEQNARRQDELVQEIAQRQKVERQLELSVNERSTEIETQNRLFEAVLDALPVAVIIAEASGKFVRINRASYEVCGAVPPTSGVEDYPEWTGYWPDSGRRLEPMEWPLSRAVFQGESCTEQIEIERFGDHARRMLQISAAPVLGANGAVIAGVVTAIDLTDREAAERSVRASEERFQTFMTHAPIAAWIVDAESRGVYTNPGFDRQLGLPPGTYLGRQPAELWPAEVAEAYVENNRRVLAGGIVVETEESFVGPDGSVGLAQVVKFPMSGPLGEQLIGGVAIDISARKQAEIAIRESEERFRRSFDDAPIGKALLAPDGKWLRVNRAACEMVGYTESDMLASSFKNITHPDDADHSHAQFGAMIEGTISEFQAEKRYIHKIGHVVHAVLSVTLLRDEAGHPLQFLTHVRDISKQKETERELAANTALLRQFIKYSPAAIAMFDREIRYVQASDRWLADYRLEGRDIIGQSHYDVFPDIPDHWKAIHRRVLAGAVERCEEDPFQRADGSTEWLQWECRPWLDASGGVGGLIMFTQVITERKRAEEALRSSEERFRVLFEQSSDAHLIFSENDGILDCNPAAVAMLRCADIQTLLRLHPAALSPEFQPDGRRSMEKCVEMDSTARRNGYHRFDWNHRRLDGDVFPCEVTLTPVTLDGQSVILVVWHDLTERQQAEMALRESEERFRAAMEGSLDAIYFLTAERAPTGDIADFRFADLNRRGCALLNRTREQALGQRLCEMLPANRTAGLFDKFVRVVETGEPMEEEFWVDPSEGLTASWLRHQVIRVGDGVTITTQDITARKQVEAALRLSEERFRRLVDGVSDHAIFMLDVDGHVVSWNPAAEQIKGYSTEEIVGRHFSVFYTPDAVAAGHPEYELAEAIAKGRYHEEGERVRKDGSRFWAAMTISALLDETGRHVGFVKFTYDITQRKQSEEQIRASLREKDVMLKEIHHRVKNNLQIVSALLELQSGHTTDQAVLEMFRESQGRVKSMALIHERLYRSGDFAGVDFGEYVRQLADDLYRTYKVSDDGIRLELDVDIPPVPIDIAIPCGLLLNELVSNCLKHAFRDATEGMIHVSLTRDGDTTVLSVSDDGAGFKEGVDFHNTSSFGLQLVNTLVEQLDGEVQLRTSPGTTITVRFPKHKS